jgi:ABC-type multidrug transport system permease subunit
MEALADKRIKDFIVNFLISTPKALLILVFSFLSGQVWTYLIIVYFKGKTKGNTILTQYYTKISIGVLWFSVIAIPLTYLKNGFSLTLNLIINDSLTSILISMLIQAIIFAYLTAYKKEK